MKKFLLGMVMLFGILFSMPVVNGAVEQVGNGATVRVKGNAGDKNAAVTIEVFKGALGDNINGKTLLGLTREKYRDILVCHDQSVTDSEGKYSFDFNINLTSGKYSVYVATQNNSLPPEEFVFISNKDFKSAVELVNTSKNEGDIEEYLKTYPYEMGLTPEVLEQLSISGLSSVLFETIKKYNLDADNREKTWNITKKALFIQKLNENKVDNIFLMEDTITSLSQSTISSWYHKSYVTDALQINMTSRLSGKNIISYQAYEDLLAEAFILATIKEPNGNGNVKNIMTEFADKIGIVVTNADSNIWVGLAGRDFLNLGELKKEYNLLSNIQVPDKIDKKSSGSGGSGKSVGSVKIEPLPDNKIVDNRINNEIFTDIGGIEWAKAAIITLAEKGIINGSVDGKFCPNDNITREEFCKIVVGAFVPNVDANEINFSDAERSAWYYPYLQKAYKEGIANGLGNGMFGVGNPITRQDLAVMIYNAAKKSGMVFDSKANKLFSDDTKIAGYAKDAIYALRGAGAINGITDAEFAPEGFATRAQAAKIIYVLLNGN